MNVEYVKQAESYLNKQPKFQTDRIQRAVEKLPETWDDIEEDDPTPDEIEAFMELRNSR